MTEFPISHNADHGSCLPLSRILYEDKQIICINKPACIPTVPDSSGDLSLLEMAKAYIKRSANKPGNVFLAVVHRLDRPVSGIVCFAKRSKAASRLSMQMRDHQIKKEYISVVTGCPDKNSGVSRGFISKDRRRNLVKFQTGNAGKAGNGKEAVTAWEVLEKRDGLCLIRLRPETGRPHQLRVTMAALRCPIIGDLRYGPGPPLPDRSIALHAERLLFAHPITGRRMEIQAPVAEPDGEVTYPWNLFLMSGQVQPC